MTERTRRAFIGTAAAGVAGSLLGRYTPALRAQQSDSRLEILVGEPIGTIAPEIYGHKFTVTPNFHVFAMYAAHQGAQALRTVWSAPAIALTRDGRGQALWGLAGSASLRDKALTVTVVNPHATDPRECAIAVRGAEVREGRARVLSSTDLRAHNSFEQPSALAPVDAPVRVTAGSLTHRFPAASVTRLQLTLA